MGHRRKWTCRSTHQHQRPSKSDASPVQPTKPTTYADWAGKRVDWRKPKRLRYFETESGGGTIEERVAEQVTPKKHAQPGVLFPGGEESLYLFSAIAIGIRRHRPLSGL